MIPNGSKSPKPGAEATKRDPKAAITKRNPNAIAAITKQKSKVSTKIVPQDDSGNETDEIKSLAPVQKPSFNRSAGMKSLREAKKNYEKN